MNFIDSYVSVAGVVWLLSMAMISCSSIAIFFCYILPYIHAFFIELIIYAGSVVLVYYAQFCSGHVPVLMATTGCLFFLFAVIMTCSLHLQKNTVDHPHFINIVSFMCAILWASVALYYQSRLIGFMSVAAGYVSLNFMVRSTPFVLMIGFTKENSIPTAMMASFILVCWYVYSKLQVDSMNNMTAHVFSSGILFMGPLVFFISCLIVSSKWYQEDTVVYFVCNVLTVVTLLACFFFGSIKGLENLYNFACIIGVVYVMGKYIEIPWTEGTWMWGMMGAGMLLYTASFYAHILLDKMSSIEL